jgi:flagellar basal-body rod modification protein FlgD
MMGPLSASQTPVDTSTAVSSASAAASSPQTLSAQDFIQILIAEMQNQDPTNPVDPTEFATQLVQFSDLSELQDIDQKVGQPTQDGLAQAASGYLGREVVAPGDNVGVKNGKATSVVFTPVASGDYQAQVFNLNGEQVATVDLGSLGGGALATFTWSPPSNSDGLYTVQIVDSNNQPVAGLLEQGVVQNVQLINGAIEFDLGNLVVPETTVEQVAQPG